MKVQDMQCLARWLMGGFRPDIGPNELPVGVHPALPPPAALPLFCDLLHHPPNYALLLIPLHWLAVDVGPELGRG